jgi:hypothetical protein
MWKVSNVMPLADGGYGFNVTTDRRKPLARLVRPRSLS